MVKADIRRDYYADLGLTPSAETDDIKRSFRKLALKYHPDRNPGHEVEFNSKFQAIQAANEILSDPQQRLKYDTDRLRAGYRSSYAPRPAPRPSRPPQAAPTPPTPKPSKSSNNRASYAQWTGPKPAPTAPSPGSQRYNTYARAGPQNWQKPADDAQTRADAFKGFSGMRGNGGSAGWRGFDPQTGRSSAGSTTGGAPRAQAPFGTGNGTPRAGKSAFEAFNGMNSSSPNSANSAKKKSGYAPGNAAGDEPPARNTSAYTHNRSERPSSMYFEPAPPPTARKPPPAPEPPQFPEGMERNRRGYAATGGERTTFSSTPLGRSASARTPSSSAGFRQSNSRTNPPSPDYPHREEGHYSESPDPRRTKEARRKGHYKDTDWTSSSELDESEEEFDAGIPRGTAQPKPKAVPKSRLRAKQNFSDFHRPENPNPNHATGEDPFNVPRLRRRRDSTPPAPESHPPYSPPPRYRRDSAIHSSQHRTDEDYYEGHNSDSAFSRGSDRPHYSAQSQDSRPREDPSEGSTERSQTRFGEHNGFHKKFSADDWRAHLDNFDFLGASAKRMYSSRASNSPVSGSKSRSRNSLHTDSTDSVPSSKSPGPNMFGSGLGDQPQPQPSDPQQSQSQAPSPFPFAQAKFSADEWSKQLHDLQWNPPDPETTRKSANNTPPTPRSRKQSRAGAKVRSVPKPASVASEVDEATKTVNDEQPASMPAQSAPAEAEAMDIDDELPSPPVNTAPGSPTKNGDYPDLGANVTQEPQAPGPAPPQPPQQTQPPAQPPTQPQPQNGVPREEVRAPLFNLDNLRNTAPFTNTTSGGIENLGDVHDTLPFESRAKQQTTTERDIRPRELNLPNPPKRPWAPKLVSMGPNTQVLPIDKWRHYTSAMSAYIHEWNQFNRRMLLHFNTRQEAIETGLSPNWMSAVGDTTRLKLNGDDDDSNDHEPSESDLDEYLVPGSKKGGFSAYVRGIEEDIQVRKHWDVACEMHRECILDLGRLREWIRNGGKLVSFSTA